MPSTPAHQGRGPRPEGDGLEARRERVMDALTQAYAQDRIDVDEYERRAALAQRNDLPQDLDALVADLDGRSLRLAEEGAREAAHTRAMGLGQYHDGTSSVACVMSDRRMVGDWLQGDKADSFTLMGSTTLDLRDVDLPAGPIRIESFTLMGETVVIVPRGLPVKLNAFAFMGDSRAGREVSQNVRGARTWVEVSGFVMMGSLLVKAKD